MNGQFTVDGGTHQTAFRLGVLKAIDEYAGQNFAAEDVREGMIGAVAIKIKDPVFESQTKHKLGNNEIRGWVAEEVKQQTLTWLHRNEAEAKKLVEKIKSNERIRKELSTIKKQAREMARKVEIHIPKLTDCKIHLRRPEGQAPGGDEHLPHGRGLGRRAHDPVAGTCTRRPSSPCGASR